MKAFSPFEGTHLSLPPSPSSPIELTAARWKLWIASLYNCIPLSCSAHLYFLDHFQQQVIRWHQSWCESKNLGHTHLWLLRWPGSAGVGVWTLNSLETTIGAPAWKVCCRTRYLLSLNHPYNPDCCWWPGNSKVYRSLLQCRNLLRVSLSMRWCLYKLKHFKYFYKMLSGILQKYEEYLKSTKWTWLTVCFLEGTFLAIGPCRH